MPLSRFRSARPTLTASVCVLSLCAFSPLWLGAMAAQASPPAPTRVAQAAVTAQRAARTVTVTDADTGKEIALHPGDTLVVRLIDPGDSGSSWYSLQSGQDLLRPLPFQHEQETRRPGFVGGFGTDVFRFVVVGGGGTATLAEYVRFFEIQPFEKDPAQGRFWQVHVTVQ